MLTRDHAIVDYRRGRVLPDRLTQSEHAHYLRYAQRMLLVYRRGTGRTRQQLHRDVHHIFAAELDCPPRRIDAFCKLLDDAGEYERDRPGRAAALRRTVFRSAAAWHPLVGTADSLYEHEVTAVRQRIAEQLGRSWDEIDHSLFADVHEFQRLARFDGYPDARALLARYNVAQVQAALFDAVSMTVWATDDFKTILRYAKLARLMHSIRRLASGRYEIRFDGPASVLRETRRYGVAMARFLPALLACRNWRMHAVLRPARGWPAALDLSPADKLNSHLPAPAEFDSDLETAFASKWGDRPRHGWTCRRETEILHAGQKVFIPDFSLHHEDGRIVLLEIIGFWTPEYLQAKFDTLRAFAHVPILLAMTRGAGDAMPERLPPHTIPFKSAIRIQDVLDRLEHFPTLSVER